MQRAAKHGNRKSMNGSSLFLAACCRLSFCLLVQRGQQAVGSKFRRDKQICRIFGFICLLPAVFLPAGLGAQQPKKVPRIGFLTADSFSALAHRTAAFRQGLRALGYVEGKTIVIEWRSAEGKLDRLPALAAELVNLKVEVIVTGGSGATRPANEATSTIPIVMTQDPDPVRNGFVASLARPGGNITGLSNFVSELSGKRLELLKETVPKLARVAVFGTSTSPGNSQALRDTELAAGALAVTLQYLDVRGSKDIEAAFRAASKEQAQAFLGLGGPVLASNRAQIVELSLKARLPTIYWRSDIVEAGGVMSYATSITDLDRRAATYVDTVLKGVKPADLPVEQPTKFDFIINLRTAKQIGLTIPPNVLARADRVIK
jgi:putative ABC transport system substrate-binding protein